MEACGFPQENLVLHPPSGMTADECAVLSAFAGQDSAGWPVVITCWKLTAEELAEVQRTGRVWLGVLGQTMPPVWLVGTNPFC